MYAVAAQVETSPSITVTHYLITANQSTDLLANSNLTLGSISDAASAI